MVSQIPWRRITAEGVVIVVSILLAFAIDAWWETNRAAAQHAAQLDAVFQEVELNRNRLQDRLGAIQRRLAASDSFMDVSYERAVATDSAALNRWFFLATTSGDFEVSTMVLLGLPGGSLWEEEEDPILKRHLADFVADLENVQEATEGQSDYVDSNIEPYLRTRVDLRALSATGRQEMDHVTGWDETLHELEFRNLLLQNHSWLSFTADAMEGAIDTADQVLSLRAGPG